MVRYARITRREQLLEVSFPSIQTNFSLYKVAFNIFPEVGLRTFRHYGEHWSARNCQMLRECHDNAYPAFYHTYMLHIVAYAADTVSGYALFTCCIYFIRMPNTSLESFSRR